MSMIDETRFVERLQFFNGQRLFASDLQGLDTFNREMRWLHNQSLHQPGIGSGYWPSGEKGAREITVGAGYAIDSLGREIVLTEPQTIPIPPVAGQGGKSIFFDLVVAYPDDETLEEAESREGICMPRGVLRLREQPLFCWVELEGTDLAPKKAKLRLDLQDNLKIRVARIEVLNCQLNAKVSIAQRQSARPAQTPYIASGREPIGTLEPLSATGLALPIPGAVGSKFKGRVLKATVDTSKAEFLTPPEYIAQLSGPRHLSIPQGSLEILIIDRSYITASTKNSFDFFAFLLFIVLSGTGDFETADVPAPKEGDPAITRIAAAENEIKSRWRLTWMGIEA